ncbi:MAG: type II toxin-antitoxin system VapC family toxin [Chloroflexi bacterium]|nr:type II toxin-antitoxin system VapC family toxin [Chloroflexota bacterium]
MTRYLLDTDAVIDLLYKISGTVNLLQGLLTRGDSLCTCDVVLTEAFSGFHPHEREKAQAFFDDLEFLDTTVASARLAGEWRYMYARRGQPLAVPDCLIAATAYAHQAVVVTGNVKDFPMPEIMLLPIPRQPRRSGR